MTADDLNTPALLVDVDRLEANIDRMQQLADREGVHLRPHTKTHKCVEIARRQRERGAEGITVAKPSEAEVFAAAGFKDIRIAYEVVTSAGIERLMALQAHCRTSVCVDTLPGASRLSESFAESDREIDVLVEVDTGHGRCGVAWDDHDITDFVRRITELRGLNWCGLLTHGGHAYHGPTVEGETAAEALDRCAAEERDRVLEAAVRLQAHGLAPAEISIGSTPSLSRFANKERDGLRITEIRPGNYVFNDATQVGLTTTTLDHCALTVLATVISKRRDRSGTERLFLDAGKKVVTTDTGFGTTGYGILLYNPRTMTPLPHASITGLSEEHGWVEVPGGSTMQVGDRVQFVPNHACVTVDTRDEMILVKGDEVVGRMRVDARGLST